MQPKVGLIVQINIFDFAQKVKAISDEMMLVPLQAQRPIKAWEKRAGDFVTEIDLAMDKAIHRLLIDTFNVPVLSEEGAKNPYIVPDCSNIPWLWIADPVDGTGNMLKGGNQYSCMVALAHYGNPVAAVIYQPPTGRLAVAELGAGTYLNGQRVSLEQHPRSLLGVRGIVGSNDLPPHLAMLCERSRASFAHLGSTRACGNDYLNILAGQLDFSLFLRTFPWDHAPGHLLVNEAGGRSDSWRAGRSYSCADSLSGILSASPVIFEQVRQKLQLASQPELTDQHVASLFERKKIEYARLAEASPPPAQYILPPKIQP